MNSIDDNFVSTPPCCGHVISADKQIPFSHLINQFSSLVIHFHYPYQLIGARLILSRGMELNKAGAFGLTRFSLLGIVVGTTIRRSWNTN